MALLLKHGFSKSELRTIKHLSDVLLPAGQSLPGAAELGLAERMDSATLGWNPRIFKGVRLLVRSWEWSPLLSKHLKRFSRLAEDARREWVADCYGSRVAWKRLQIAGLKQLLFI